MSPNYKLFEHMSKEHGLTLTETELNDIVCVVQKSLPAMTATEELYQRNRAFLDALAGLDRYGIPDPEVIAVLEEIATYIDDHAHDQMRTERTRDRIIELVQKLPVKL